MSTPLATFDALSSTNGLLQPSKVFAKHTSILVRQATPAELLGYDGTAPSLSPTPGPELVSDQSPELEEAALEPIDEASEVLVAQTEETYDA